MTTEPQTARRATLNLLSVVQGAGEDFEWYPTSERMIDAVARHLPTDAKSLMDIGAGDGRVLLRLAQKCESAQLYAIEKSNLLIQAQPENVVPVGTDLFEQNLACLPVDFIFCNPPYSQFESWATVIIETGHAKTAYLVIPRRWKDSAEIAAALERRGATASVIHSDDFLSGADRTARAIVDIVEVSYPRKDCGGWRSEEVKDPFDTWFDEHISTFDEEESPENWQAEEERKNKELARLRQFDTITEMVDGYNEEFARMEANYRAIFQLDYALLKELGVKKDATREGIKAKMAGLKSKYWALLFERLGAITERLSTKTKARFLEKLTGRAAVAFTANNAYAIVLWAIKNANAYFNEQTVQLYRDLSTRDGVMNYASNRQTWQADNWRYLRYCYAEDEGKRPSRYALDYRIVVTNGGGIVGSNSWHSYGAAGNLAASSHELIDDVRAVLNNFGFPTMSAPPRSREWFSGTWQNWYLPGKDDTGPGAVLFQVKAHMNGNLHFRFLPDAIKALNVEAGRLLGWLRSPAEVESELGYTPEESKRFYSSMRLIEPSHIRLLAGEIGEVA